MKLTGHVLLCSVMLMAEGSSEAPNQAIFDSPDEAVKALLYAVESGNYSLFLYVAGTQMAQFWDSGDPERDALERDRFVNAARRNGLKPYADVRDQNVLRVGEGEIPFPAPLVKTESGWSFDGVVGSVELAARKIRRNETAAVELCERFRDAEFNYLAVYTGRLPTFAQRVRSSPGQRDGLFWSISGGEEESPVGPAFAAAAYGELTPAEGLRPLFGYYFKILVAQGSNATGGELDYRVKGQLRKGFALIAWPAEYGVDGVHSFLISHFGDLYQKDLGMSTRREAESIAVFDPDRSWTRIEGRD